MPQDLSADSDPVNPRVQLILAKKSILAELSLQALIPARLIAAGLPFRMRVKLENCR